MNETSPQISVVVPTFNRAERLSRLVAALEAQRDAPPFEVVIVDNGSVDDTPQVLSTLKEASSLCLNTLRLDVNQGPSRARNAGWQASRSEIVVFTDDDCVPQPGWIAALARWMQNFDLVQGRTIPNPEQRDKLSWFSHTVSVEDERGFYETCNIAYRRELLEKADGFDESYFIIGNRAGRAEYGDDTDLGWRALELGARSAFAPDAEVWHDIQTGGLVSRLRLLPRQGGIVRAVRRHPSLRRSFDHPWFYQRAHPRAIGLVIGALQVAVRPLSPWRWLLAVVLFLPWYRHRAAMVGRGARLSVLPKLLVFDVAETTVFVRASLRHRTWLL